MRDDAAVVVRVPLARGFALVCLILLAGACNHELAPPPLPPGTGSGAGGVTGGDGFGGQGGNTSCFTGDSCVQSCFTDFPGPVSGYCDATGAFACPADTVRLSTCAPNACAQFTSSCCDDITGAHGQPPCGPDGLKQVCAAGSHPYDYRVGCIPTGLGVTQCLDLEGKGCDLQGQSCTQGDAFCDCRPAAGDGGALAWWCAVLI
jgi:hypothetical protein